MSKRISQPADLIVITSYPKRGYVHGAGTVGGASYTKNTLLSLIKATANHANPKKIIVLAERLHGELEHAYEEDGMTVKRVWQRNNLPRSYSALIKEVCNYSAKKILIEFEFAMFGSIFSLALFPFFILWLKLQGKQTYLVMHQVIRDIDMLAGHINVNPRSTRSLLFNTGIHLFYTTTFPFVDKVIVFEEFLKEKVTPFVSTRKVIVIPHGVEQYQTALSYEQARNALHITQNDFVLLLFGFIAWYKGTDWLVEAVKQSNITGKNLKLIIAGGPNPNHESKEFYQKYIQAVEKSAQSSSGAVTVTGFVPEDAISSYFIAADLIVFPYRTLMSSSGPLSLAFSFGKPFLLSEQLEGVTKTEDMRSLMEQYAIETSTITFPLNYEKFGEKLTAVAANYSLLETLQSLSRSLRKKRNFATIAEQYYELLFA